MLLVAEDSGDKSGDGRVEKIELISPDAPVGTKVTALGIESKPRKQITLKDFLEVKLEVKNFEVLAAGAPLIAAGKQLRTAKIRNGKVT